MTDQIERECSVCGADLTITVFEDGEYSGGHYFEMGDSDMEYWECDECYND